MLVAMCLLGMALPAVAQQSKSQDWYPANIAPPAGHKYPCALTALPKDLAGIPPGDRRFINHTYAMVLKCLRAKLIAIDTMLQNGAAYGQAYAYYYSEATAARKAIMAEPVPAGAEGFRNEVVNAIDKQIGFFAKAATLRQRGGSAQDVLNIPEGKTASAILQRAWGSMESKYPAMSPTVKDSTYHHLCAMDVF